MKRLTKPLFFIATVVSTVAFAGVGWAYWSTVGGGTASATVGTVAAPTAVHGTSTAGTGTVGLAWTAVSSPNGTSTDLGYWVQRSKDGGAYTDACASSHASPLKPSTVSSCSDTGLTNGSYIYTVTAVFKSWTALSAPSAAITVSTTGPAAKLAFTQQPSGSTGGVAFTTQPKVTIQDAGGNTVTNDTSSVTLAITTPAGATLTCTTNPQGAVSGVATFTGCAIDKVGTYTLTATDGTLTSAASNSLSITTGAAAKLAFTQQPSGSTGGVAFTTQPKVTIQDAGGNTVTGNSSAVTLSITSGTPTSGGPGTLAGTVTVNATSGVATFTGLSINTAGNGYKLHATAGSLAADSNSFNITVGAMASVGWTNISVSNSGTVACDSTNSQAVTCGAAVGNGGSFQASVQLIDLGGNAVPNSGSTITVTRTNSGPGTASTNGTMTIATGASATTGTFKMVIPTGQPAASTITAQVVVNSVTYSVNCVVTRS